MFSAASKTGSQAAAFNYVEDVFSTYLYTGNGSTQTITNGIDLSTKGGLVWQKIRGTAGYDHVLTDTVTSGTGSSTQFLSSNTTNGFSSNVGAILNSYNSNGFTLGTGSGYNNVNGTTACSWTFRKQPKFFDVVTWTGNGGTQNISHSLGSAPGMIWVKNLTTSTNWVCYHRSLPSGYILYPNGTSGQDNFGTIPQRTFGNNSTPVAPTSTVFTVGGNNTVNSSGDTFVAYIFAHNAGGFGLTGTDNVISCGSYTGNGSATGPVINLGYEPQWVMIKCSSTATQWFLYDTMRGMSQTEGNGLFPNLTNPESTGANCTPTATGFQILTANGNVNASGDTFIYMAIRRPMKVPTDATTVFKPLAVSTGVQTTGFPIDLQIASDRASNSILNSQFIDRLRGVSSTTTEQGKYLISSATDAESSTYPYSSNSWNNTGFKVPQNYDGGSNVFYSFSRRPGFFDEVCYTGAGATSYAHNLGVVPELMIVKCRSAAVGAGWAVYSATTGASKYLKLQNTTAAITDSGPFGTTPTSTVFYGGGDFPTSYSGYTYVAYLFATCAGVSKVGSYTGNGTTQAISCGFTGGARFVLIKRTDSTGDWYVYDTARGMTVLTDPYLLLNTTDAEVATLGSVTTTAGGFTVNASILSAINTNAASYIFLAIA